MLIGRLNQGEWDLDVLARQYGAIGTEIASIDKSMMALHRIADFYETAWHNEGSDFARNGERFMLERIPLSLDIEDQ